ncbi:hypothetical protein [Taklimakanibacter lacteus]|uniref:hypothetical protein n=1 Tax=Taklimakanibacter lacteus TaxID=2268456 RepID=UPI000E663D92
MQNAFASSPPATGPTVTVSYDDLAAAADRLLTADGLSSLAEACGKACAFLEACSYPGLALLFEALDTTPPDARHPDLVPDSLGLDLGNASCVFLAPRIMRLVEQQGRLFLRNVRHGLYLVPFSVTANIGIGCPVDPAFALGGERTRNPFEEKLALARRDGVAVAESLWRRARVA